MKFASILVLSTAALGVTATPMLTSPATVLEKRVDNWCVVDPNLRDVDCRSAPGVGAGTHKQYINPGQRFGVNCIKVVGGRTWDWIPGWRCWVTARATLSDDRAHPSCESGISTCP